jgi:hypothetical protein
MKSEQDFLTYLDKTSEALETNDTTSTSATAEVYSSQKSEECTDHEPVEFSDTAQSSSKDVREGVLDRVLIHTQKERALIGNILDGKSVETQAIQLRPVEKVSHPRSQTLMEQTRNLLNRV